jgi:hypothetical protein
MSKEKSKSDGPFLCPVGKFFCDLEKATGGNSEFFAHLSRSRIEFLKAMRAFVDERIEGLEKKTPPRAQKKMTKIKVE